MGREAWVGGGGGADLGDVDGSAGEGGEYKSLREGFVSCEAQEFGNRCCHLVVEVWDCCSSRESLEKEN